MKRILFKTLLLSFCYLVSITLNSAVAIQTQPIPLEIILNDDIDGAQKALKRGYNINARYKDPDYREKTPLLVATSSENLEMINFLLLNGANINEIDPLFGTPLMRASYFSRIEIIELLIQHKANLNFQDNEGNNALISNLNTFMNKDVIKLLLNAGADYNQENNQGESFKKLIYESEFETDYLKRKIKEIIQVFEEYIENQNKIKNQKVVNQLIQFAEQNNLEEVIKLLHEKPFLIDISNEMGETILNQAILFERLDLIKKLFEDSQITQKPDLLTELDSPNNPIIYAQYLRDKVYDKSNFTKIINYLEKQLIHIFKLKYGREIYDPLPLKFANIPRDKRCRK